MRVIPVKHDGGTKWLTIDGFTAGFCSEGTEYRVKFEPEIHASELYEDEEFLNKMSDLIGDTVYWSEGAQQEPGYLHLVNFVW